MTDFSGILLGAGATRYEPRSFLPHCSGCGHFVRLTAIRPPSMLAESDDDRYRADCNTCDRVMPVTYPE